MVACPVLPVFALVVLALVVILDQVAPADEVALVVDVEVQDRVGQLEGAEPDLVGGDRQLLEGLLQFSQ